MFLASFNQHMLLRQETELQYQQSVIAEQITQNMEETSIFEQTQNDSLSAMEDMANAEMQMAEMSMMAELTKAGGGMPSNLNSMGSMSGVSFYDKDGNRLPDKDIDAQMEKYKKLQEKQYAIQVHYNGIKQSITSAFAVMKRTFESQKNAKMRQLKQKETRLKSRETQIQNQLTYVQARLKKAEGYLESSMQSLVPKYTSGSQG